MLHGVLNAARGTVRRRLAGLTDDEFFWQAVPGCWTVHEDDERPLVFIVSTFRLPTQL